MTKGMDKMIAQMRQQHEELTVAIRVFDRMNGSNGKALKNVSQAAMAVSGQPIAAIEGLKDLKRIDAIRMALQSVGRPLMPKQVADLLRASGRVEKTSAVNVALAGAAKHKQGVKRVKAGYVYAGA